MSDSAPTDGDLGIPPELAVKLNASAVAAIERAMQSGTTEDYRAAQVALQALKASGKLHELTEDREVKHSKGPAELVREIRGLLKDPDVAPLFADAPKPRKAPSPA